LEALDGAVMVRWRCWVRSGGAQRRRCGRKAGRGRCWTRLVGMASGAAGGRGWWVVASGRC